MKDNARISEAERARRAEAAKNLAELFYTLEKMEEADKKRTSEERDRNKVGFTCEDGKFVYF